MRTTPHRRRSGAGAIGTCLVVRRRQRPRTAVSIKRYCGGCTNATATGPPATTRRARPWDSVSWAVCILCGAPSGGSTTEAVWKAWEQADGGNGPAGWYANYADPIMRELLNLNRENTFPGMLERKGARPEERAPSLH